jgi:hypothetical protein
VEECDGIALDGTCASHHTQNTADNSMPSDPCNIQKRIVLIAVADNFETQFLLMLSPIFITTGPILGIVHHVENPDLVFASVLCAALTKCGFLATCGWWWCVPV